MLLFIIILQMLSIVLSIAGILIEFIYEAHWGFVFITASSIIFAGVTKFFELYLYRENRRLNNEKQNSYE